MIDKITYPLTAKELTVKINEIIDVLGVGDVSDIKVEDGNIVFTKEDGDVLTVALPSYVEATSTQAGLISAEDYNFIQNLKNAQDDGVSNVPMVIPYANCPTAKAEQNKVATVINGGVFSLKQGAMVMVAFQYDPYRTDGKAITLNVNNTGAKAVCYSGITNGYYTSESGANRLLFVYDGTRWVCVSPTVYTYSSNEDSGA